MLTLDTPVLDWGDDLIEGQDHPTRRIHVRGLVPIRSLDVARPPLFGTATVSRVGSDPDRFVVAVQPDASLRPGPFDRRLVIGIINDDGASVPGAAVSLRGTVQLPVRAVPSPVLLGTHAVGELAESHVVLQPRRTLEFVVEKVQPGSADLDVVAVEVEGLPPGRTFRLRQRIAREGDRVETVRFSMREVGGKAFVLSVEVWYRGEPKRPEGTKP